MVENGIRNVRTDKLFLLVDNRSMSLLIRNHYQWQELFKASCGELELCVLPLLDNIYLSDLAKLNQLTESEIDRKLKIKKLSEILKARWSPG